jgi:hypothetical protein
MRDTYLLRKLFFLENEHMNAIREKETVLYKDWLNI